MIKIIHSIIASLFLCNIAVAEVRVVPDTATSSDTMSVKVLAKQPVYQQITKAGTKNVCVKTGRPVHYMGYGKGHTMTFRDAPMNSQQEFYCHKVDEPVMVKVLVGYQVTYEFRGTIMHDFLDYEPSDYVQVYSGK